MHHSGRKPLIYTFPLTYLFCSIQSWFPLPVYISMYFAVSIYIFVFVIFVHPYKGYHCFKGFLPEWYISTMIYSRVVYQCYFFCVRQLRAPAGRRVLEMFVSVTTFYLSVRVVTFRLQGEKSVAKYRHLTCKDYYAVVCFHCLCWDHNLIAYLFLFLLSAYSSNMIGGLLIWMCGIGLVCMFVFLSLPHLSLWMCMCVCAHVCMWVCVHL